MRINDNDVEDGKIESLVQKIVNNFDKNKDGILCTMFAALSLILSLVAVPFEIVYYFADEITGEVYTSQSLTLAYYYLMCLILAFSLILLIFSLVMYFKSDRKGIAKVGLVASCISAFTLLANIIYNLIAMLV